MPETGGLLPHVIEAGGVVEQLAGIGEEVLTIVGKNGQKTASVSGGANNGWLAGDTYVAGGVDQGGPEATYFVDEAEGERLLAGPDLARGERFDLILGGVA